MTKILIAAAFLTAAVSTANAKPKTMTDADLAETVAGIAIGKPVGPGPILPLPPYPAPVLNPGGPILISCIVGVGCITRAYH